jgi:hypothetical protein
MLQSIDHTPGQPHLLTREEFIRFFGMEDSFQDLLARENLFYSEERAQRRVFWALIASMEANREFNPFDTLCSSELQMSTQERGLMRWRYVSTSGTAFEAVEYRTYDTQSAPGYPGEECGDLPPSSFRVTIPADRDIPGRYHHDRLAAGESYCG